MKYLAVLICLALGACTIPVAPLKKAEIDHFAVVEVDFESFVGHYSYGEFAYVGKIDGVDDENFKNKRKARDQPNGPRKEYVFIEPGLHELTLAYSRNDMGGLGRRYFCANVPVKAALSADRYFVRYSVEKDIVELWLENSRGILVTEKKKSYIVNVRPEMPIIIVPVK